MLLRKLAWITYCRNFGPVHIWLSLEFFYNWCQGNTTLTSHLQESFQKSFRIPQRHCSSDAVLKMDDVVKKVRWTLVFSLYCVNPLRTQDGSLRNSFIKAPFNWTILWKFLEPLFILFLGKLLIKNTVWITSERTVCSVLHTWISLDFFSSSTTDITGTLPQPRELSGAFEGSLDML